MYLTQGCNFGEIGVCLVIDYTMNESTTKSPLINDMRETYDEVKSLNWYFGVVSDVLQNRIFPQLCLKYSKHFAERVAVNIN